MDVRPTDLLAWSAAVGLSAAGMVVAVRALPPVQRAIFARKKPWACDVCMSFWATGLCALVVGYLRGPEYIFAAGPAYPLTLWTLAKLSSPQNPPQLPPLQE